jgi:hypothetical protein
MQGDLNELKQTRATFYHRGYGVAVREGRRILADSTSLENARHHFEAWLAIAEGSLKGSCSESGRLP